MILTNTCFDHNKCHLTTWSQEKINENKQTVTHTRKTIDYILIENQYKNALMDSRTHQGTKTFSDHRLLVTRMTAQWYIIHRNKNNHLNMKSETKIDTNKLVYSRKIQDKYQQKLAENMNNTNNKKWKNISEIIYQTAKSELGTVKSKTKRRSNNNQIEQLSNKQKEIKIKIENSNNPKAIERMKSERNKIMKEIKNIQRKIRNEEIDNSLKEIEEAQNDYKMFKAIKFIRDPKTKQRQIVHDEEGKIILNSKEQYKTIKRHFQKQFYDEKKEEVKRFDDNQPRPLNNPITNEEIKKALKFTANNKAPGNDKIQMELLKYAPGEVIDEIKNNLNNVFEKHEN